MIFLRLIFILFLIEKFLFSFEFKPLFDFGVEKYNYEDLLLVEFTPEIKFKNLYLGIKIDVEINSNFKAESYKWDGKEDIIRKLRFFRYRNEFLNFYIGPIYEFSFIDKFLIYKYTNQVFEPILEKRGAILDLKYKSFGFQSFIDDVIDFDNFGFNFYSNLEKIVFGLGFFIDNDIFDPYSDKGLDAQDLKVSWADINLNYKLEFNKFLITFENDFIKNINYKFYFLGSGFKFGYNYFLVRLKYIYNNEQRIIPVNYFYDLERIVLETAESGQSGAFLNIEFNKNEFINIGNEILLLKNKIPFSCIYLKTGKNFWTAFQTEIKVCNKNVEKFVDILSDRNKDSYIIFSVKIPLSKNLFLTFYYIKSFKNENEKLSALRYSSIRTEFKF